MVSLVSGGGLNRVGQNHFIYCNETHSVVVDCGKRPLDKEEEDSGKWVGPRLDFLDEAAKETNAIGVLTHAHWDHIGAMDELVRRGMPIYMSRWSEHFMNRKYAKSLMLPVDACICKLEDERISTLSHGDFNVMFAPLPHSIPGTYGVLMLVGGKNILHLGDFKFNGLHESVEQTKETFREIRRLFGKIDCLTLDVLNSELPGFTQPEQLVLDSIDKILSEEIGRVIITFFATNIDRMRGILDLAQGHGRKVHISGRSMNDVYRILKMTDDRGKRRSDRHSLNDWDILLVSGSQGEENAGLTTMAHGAHPHIQLSRGDVVVNSSRAIPGNETVIYDTLQGLYRRDVKIIIHHGEAEKLGLSFEPEEMLLHVSGHEQMGGLQEVIDILEPGVIVPFHAPPEKVDIFERNVRTSARIVRLQVGETFEI